MSTFPVRYRNQLSLPYARLLTIHAPPAQLGMVQKLTPLGHGCVGDQVLLAPMTLRVESKDAQPPPTIFVLPVHLLMVRKMLQIGIGYVEAKVRPVQMTRLVRYPSRLDLMQLLILTAT